MTLPRGISRVSDAVVSSSSAPDVFYMGVGALNTGAVCVTTDAPAHTLNGIPVSASGHVCTTSVPTPPLYSSGGLYYDSTGRLNAVTAGDALWPLYFSSGFLMDSTGSIVLLDASPPTTPTPVLLDTFTAADSTDPSSRDMDTYLPGKPRWTTYVGAGFYSSVINSGNWEMLPDVLESPGIYSSKDTALTLQASPLLAAQPSIFVMVESNYMTKTPPVENQDTGGIGVGLTFSNVNAYFQMAGSGRTVWYVEDPAFAWGWYPDAHIQSSGSVKKWGLLLNASGAYFVANGSLIGSYSEIDYVQPLGLNEIQLLQRGGYFDGPVVPGPLSFESLGGQVDEFAIYADLTLSEAIALTVTGTEGVYETGVYETGVYE